MNTHDTQTIYAKTMLQAVLEKQYDIRHVWEIVHTINCDPPWATCVHSALIRTIMSKLGVSEEQAIHLQQMYNQGLKEHKENFYKCLGV